MRHFARGLAAEGFVVIGDGDVYDGIAARRRPLAALGWMLNARNARPAFAYVPFYFVAMNFAAAGGLWRYLRGRHSVLWSKAAR